MNLPIKLVKDTISHKEIDSLCEWLSTYPQLTKGKFMPIPLYDFETLIMKNILLDDINSPFHFHIKYKLKEFLISDTFYNYYIDPTNVITNL